MGLVSGLDRALRRRRGQGKNGAPRPGAKHQPEDPSKAQEFARSLGGLILGLALASIYGALVLLVQGHSVWYCLSVTVIMGAGMGLGMAFSMKTRMIVLLALPHFFTSEQPWVQQRWELGVPGDAGFWLRPRTALSLQGRGRC